MNSCSLVKKIHFWASNFPMPILNMYWNICTAAVLRYNLGGVYFTNNVLYHCICLKITRGQNSLNTDPSAPIFPLPVYMQQVLIIKFKYKIYGIRQKILETETNLIYANEQYAFHCRGTSGSDKILPLQAKISWMFTMPWFTKHLIQAEDKMRPCHIKVMQKIYSMYGNQRLSSAFLLCIQISLCSLHKFFRIQGFPQT